jgi:hypothetical protein
MLTPLEVANLRGVGIRHASGVPAGFPCGLGIKVTGAKREFVGMCAYEMSYWAAAILLTKFRAC